MIIKFTLLPLLFISTVLLQAQTIMNIHLSDGTVLQIPLNTIDSITYTIPTPGNLATLTTLPIGNLTSTSAQSGGIITSNGGTLVTQRGVVWSTSPNPTTANNTTSDGSGTGSYTSNLTNLTANTTYYVRAYATNSAGTAYGNELSFTTSAGGGGIVSNPGAGVTYNGYTYPSIVLGNGQEWMAENLRTTAYRNGDPIPNVTPSNGQWTMLSTGAWCHFNNDSQYENPYGKLYNWYAVADPRNVCPTGWHVPTDNEWSTFINYLDPNANGGENTPNTAGDKMKSTGTQYWLSPNQDANNESGFSGLPGGFRNSSGMYGGLSGGGWWWSSTEYSTFVAWYRLVGYDTGLRRNAISKASGLSVRCLKD